MNFISDIHWHLYTTQLYSASYQQIRWIVKVFIKSEKNNESYKNPRNHFLMNCNKNTDSAY